MPLVLSELARAKFTPKLASALATRSTLSACICLIKALSLALKAAVLVTVTVTRSALANFRPFA